MDYDEVPKDTCALLYQQAIGFVQESISTMDSYDKRSTALLAVNILVFSAFLKSLSFLSILVLLLSAAACLVLMWPRYYYPAHWRPKELKNLPNEQLQNEENLMREVLKWYDDAIETNKKIIYKKSKWFKWAGCLFLGALASMAMTVVLSRVGASWDVSSHTWFKLLFFGSKV